MKKIFGILAMALLLGIPTANAGTPSPNLKKVANTMQTKCPIDINKGWVIQNLSVNNKGTNITMVINVTPERFAEYQSSPETLREIFLNGFTQAHLRSDGIIAETINSDLPLIVDVLCPESFDVITLTFMPSELASLFE